MGAPGLTLSRASVNPRAVGCGRSQDAAGEGCARRSGSTEGGERCVTPGLDRLAVFA